MTPRAGLLLGAYRAASMLFGPAAGPFLRRRLRRGKEDAGRLAERLGHAARDRPPGRLVWLHGASVGEGLALLPLIERLRERGLAVLVTTGTVTSAHILAARLPAGALHQFVPLDIPAAILRFLAHWRPDLCLLAESELWPNLILETARRGVPLALVNARLSRRSFGRWRRVPQVIAPLLRRIDLCLAQTAEDADRLAALGAARVAVAGNLKFDAAPPPAHAEALAALTAAVGARPLWVAASTHPDEEAALIVVHQRLAAARPDVLTIVVPRHAERGAAIRAAAQAAGLRAGQRSRGEVPDAQTQLYVADTMGELGLFYRLGRIVFVGKSLGGGGGQNPIEPAKLGCVVLHGPEVANFETIYRMLDAAGGALPVADAAALAAAVARLLADAAALDAAAVAATAAVVRETGAADRIIQAVLPLLAAPPPSPPG